MFAAPPVEVAEVAAGQFRVEQQSLLKARLLGVYGFEEFCHRLHALHQRHGRTGFGAEQRDREIAAYRARQAKINERD